MILTLILILTLVWGFGVTGDMCVGRGKNAVVFQETFRTQKRPLKYMQHVANKILETTAEYQELSTKGKITAAVGNHKADDLELGGYRVILRQCSSDRPSFLLVYDLHKRFLLTPTSQ